MEQLGIEELRKEKLELRNELIKVSNALKFCKDSVERKELILIRSEIQEDIKDIEAEIISLSELTYENLEALEETIDNEALDKEADAIKSELSDVLQPKQEDNEIGITENNEPDKE